MAGVQLIFDYLKPEEIEAAVEIETEGGLGSYSPSFHT